MSKTATESIVGKVQFDFHFTWGYSDTQPTNRHFQEIEVRYEPLTGRILEILSDLTVQPKTTDAFEYIQSMASCLDYHPGLGTNLLKSKVSSSEYILEDHALFVSKELFNQALASYKGGLFRVCDGAIRIAWNGVEECPYEPDNLDKK